jgi:hypothetical protein
VGIVSYVERKPIILAPCELLVVQRLTQNTHICPLFRFKLQCVDLSCQGVHIQANICLATGAKLLDEAVVGVDKL